VAGTDELQAEGGAGGSLSQDWFTEEMVDAVAKGYFEHLGWGWSDVIESAEDNGESLAAMRDDFRAALRTIAPMVEKLIVERENAVAHEAQSAMGSGLDTWDF
jgi:hypothetical protein